MENKNETVEQQIEREFAEGRAFFAAGKFELRNIATYPRMSDETIAFNADIYKEGKKAGSAENDGHGGETNFNLNLGARSDFDAASFKKMQDAIDALIYDYDNEKARNAHLRRAHKAAQSKGLNLLTIIAKGECSYLLTEATTIEEASALAFRKGAPAGAKLEFFTYRNAESILAARRAHQDKFLAKCRKKAASLNANMVICRKEGEPVKVIYTRCISLEAFKEMDKRELRGEVEFYVVPRPGQLILTEPPKINAAKEMFGEGKGE